MAESNSLMIVPQKNIAVNLFRMNYGQQELYKYLLECYRDKKEVEMESVAKIYWKYSKQHYVCFDGNRNRIFKDCSEWFEDYLKRHKDNGTEPHYYSEKNWLKSNLGSFVLRGLLTAIPKFAPDTIDVLNPKD